MNSSDPNKELVEYGYPESCLGNFLIFSHNDDFSEIYLMIQTINEVTSYYDFIMKKES